MNSKSPWLGRSIRHAGLVIGVSQIGLVHAASPGLITLHTFPSAPYSCNDYGFCGYINDGGANPYAGLLAASDGNFYGTTKTGGNVGGGTVFRLTSNGQFDTLTSFYEGPPPGYVGESPEAALIQGSDAKLYGTTVFGGGYGAGSMFYVDLTNPYINTLFAFWPDTSNRGGNSYGSILQAGSDFVTTTCQGTGYGEIIFASGGYAAFDGANSGSCPKAGLISDPSLPRYYGTASQGGTYGQGTVFYYPGNPIYPIHVFAGSPNEGSDPEAPVVYGKDGNLYGTTYSGGKYGYGTVYELSPMGDSFTTLHSFNYKDGAQILAGLIQAKDGNFYGATSAGGTSGTGSLFKITPAGRFTTLYTFSSLYGGTNADGAAPNALVQGSDGNLYGTTRNGGGSGTGTVFELIIQRPTITIKLQPARVAALQSATLTWSSTSATSCTASGAWSGSEPTSGATSASQSTSGRYSYKLTCTGPVGSASKTAYLTVK